MKTLEQLKTEQAIAIAKLEREHTIALACPVPPKSVQITSGNLGHWVLYEAETMWAALDIMRQFKPITFRRFKKSFTRFVPEPLNVGKEAGEDTGGPYVAKIDVSQGEGFGPSVYLAFFFYAGDEMCMARIELRKGYNDRFGQYGARFRASSNGRSRRLEGNRYINGEFDPNPTLSGLVDTVTKWGSGSEEAAQFGYAICADDENDDYSAGWLDAGYRLENIAQAMHGDRPEVTSN